MTLSNQTKGATSFVRPEENNPSRDTKTIQTSQIIQEIERFTHLNDTDALSAFSMMINSIKNHLLQGNNVNLGELGIMSSCICTDEKNADVDQVKIIFKASKHLKYELKEKALLLGHLKACPK